MYILVYQGTGNKLAVADFDGNGFADGFCGKSDNYDVWMNPGMHNNFISAKNVCFNMCY